MWAEHLCGSVSKGFRARWLAAFVSRTTAHAAFRHSCTVRPSDYNAEDDRHPRMDRGYPRPAFAALP